MAVTLLAEPRWGLAAQALVDGYEVIPRRPVEYRGRTLEEMDLDAILKRRPALVLPVRLVLLPGISGALVPPRSGIRLLDAEFWLLASGLLTPAGVQGAAPPGRAKGRRRPDVSRTLAEA